MDQGRKLQEEYPQGQFQGRKAPPIKRPKKDWGANARLALGEPEKFHGAQSPKMPPGTCGSKERMSNSIVWRNGKRNWRPVNLQKNKQSREDDPRTTPGQMWVKGRG